MHETKHTPGPWEVGKPMTVGIHGLPVEFLNVERPGFVAGGGIALVHAKSDTGVANAALIAAAPDMLATLIAVDAEIASLIGEVNWYASGNQAPELCRRIAAVIAKATGKAGA